MEAAYFLSFILKYLVAHLLQIGAPIAAFCHSIFDAPLHYIFKKFVMNNRKPPLEIFHRTLRERRFKVKR